MQRHFHNPEFHSHDGGGRGRGREVRNRRGDFPGTSHDGGGFGPGESGDRFARRGYGGRGGFENFRSRGEHEGHLDGRLRDPSEHHRRGGRGRRAGRGDIRSVILVLLAEEPMHGYQLIQEIVQRSGETWRPSPGAVYPALNLLEDEGFITITRDQGRKLASLTEAGKTHVAENEEQLGRVWEDAAGRGAHPARAMRTTIEGLAVAARQIAVAGNEEQIKAAVAILERSQRELYLILAGEPGPRDSSGENSDENSDENSEENSDDESVGA